MTVDHNNVGTGSGVGGGGTSGGGGGVPADSPNFTTQWSLNGDARWTYEAANTVGVHTTTADAHSTGQGLIQHVYTYYTDGSNYERWNINAGNGGGNLLIQHVAVGTYDGTTRNLVLSPTNWLAIGGGSGILPKNDGSMALGEVSGYAFNKLVMAPIAEPATPTNAAGFVLYVDQADGKLKAKGASGTVTPLANP